LNFDGADSKKDRAFSSPGLSQILSGPEDTEEEAFSPLASFSTIGPSKRSAIELANGLNASSCDKVSPAKNLRKANHHGTAVCSSTRTFDTSDAPPIPRRVSESLNAA
jgi:hypothetical protein